MKRLFAAVLVLIGTLSLSSCFSEKNSDTSMLVCSFSGGDGQFSVSNGIVVIAEDKEVSSGWDLAVNGDFSDVTAACMQFYVVSDGEEHTVLSCIIENHAGEAVELNGDTGAASGRNIFPKSAKNVIPEYLDHVWLRLTLICKNSAQKMYELPMTVKLIFEK